MHDDRDLLIPDYGVHHRDGVPSAELVAQLRADGWRVFVIDGSPKDKEGFVDAVKRALPLDPPIARGKWDALSDSLWEGLDSLNAEKAAIVWPDSRALLAGDSPAYSTAVAVFTDLVFSLADLKFTVDHVTRLLVLLL